MKEPNRLPASGKKWAARAAVAAGFILSGCGASPATVSSSRSLRRAQPPAWRDPLSRSLGDFRERVDKHQKVQVLMGACVGWPNESGGLTITLNPGIGSGDGLKRRRDYYVFSAEDSGARADRPTQMNGPTIGDDRVATLLFRPRGMRGGWQRALSRNLTHDPNQQVYYTDEQTGEPVMDTVLTSGPPTIPYLGRVCDALRNHQAVPPNHTHMPSQGNSVD